LYNGSGPQKTAYAYDPYNRRISETLPDVGDGHTRITATAYDRLAGVIGITDPLGQVTQQVFDRAGRMTRSIQTRAGGSLAEMRVYLYDDASMPVLVTDSAGVSQYTYDELNRVRSEYRSNRGQAAYSIASEFDAVGNRTRVVYPGTGRTLVYTYDRQRDITSVSDGAQKSVATYASSGNRLTLQTPNGVRTEYTYDALNRLLAVSAHSPSGPVFEGIYGRDLAGNRLDSSERVGAAARNVRYAYDARQQLIQESWPGERRDYAYDLAGNRIRRTVQAGAAVSQTEYNYDALNRLVEERAGGTVTTFAYDLNGNLILRQPGALSTAYAWDNNRLIGVSQGPSQLFAAVYDYRGRRVNKVEAKPTSFVYDSGDAVQEIQSGGVKEEYVRGGGVGGGIAGILYGSGGGTGDQAYSYDPVGSTVALSDQQGNVSASYLYDAFGAVLAHAGSAATNRLANTKELDGTGLYYHGLRYYDPQIGRYISRDPAGGLGGINPYVYVGNNPVNRVDPHGLWDWDEFFTDVAIGVVAVAVVTAAIVAAPIVAPLLAAAAATAVDVVAAGAGAAALAVGADAATATAVSAVVTVAGTAAVAEVPVLAAAAVEAAGVVGTADMVARAATGQMSDEEAAATIVTLGFGVLANEAVEAIQSWRAAQAAQQAAQEGAEIQAAVKAGTSGESPGLVTTDGTYEGKPFTWETTQRMDGDNFVVFDPDMMQVDPGIQGRGIGGAILDEHLARAQAAADALGVPPGNRYYTGVACTPEGKGLLGKYFPGGIPEPPPRKLPLPKPIGRTVKLPPPPPNRTATGLALLGAADTVAYVASPN